MHAGPPRSRRSLARRAWVLHAVGVCLALQVLEPSSAIAQHQFDSWTTENGLPQNSVNDILQTRDGYLWLATFGGLVRFDGVRFVVFDRGIDGIESQRVVALFEDSHGTLWAGTDDGILIRYRGGRFTSYSRRDGLPNASATLIQEDDEGSLWVTWTTSITKFDGRRFVNFGANHFPHHVAPPPPARYMDAWWSHDSTGLHVLVKGRVETFPIRRESLGAGILGVFQDRCGTVWISTNGAGLIKAEPGRLERYTNRDGLPNDFAAHGDCDGVVVWGGSKVYRIRNEKAEPIDLPGTRVVYVDREGSMWFGNILSGLQRLRDATVTLVAPPGPPLHKVAYQILPDRTGAVWIGSGGLKRFFNGRFTSYWSAVGFSPDVITSLYQDKSGRLWVGTVGGLKYLDNGRFIDYDGPSGFGREAVSAILEDRTGAVWFATNTGLVKLAGGRFTRYTTSDGLSHDRIMSLFEDRAGTLWIGAYHGLTRFKNGVFTAYAEKEGLVGSQVRAIHEDGDGVLWIGTYDGGLYRLANEQLTRYTRNDGLHDNGVFQILEDDAGYLWTGSNRGISRVSRHELNEFAEGRRRKITPVVLGTKDGLASVEINGGRQPSGAKTADGKLWFPTMAGVAVVDPAVFRRDTRPPRAIIEEVRLNGEPQDFTGGLRVGPNTPAFEIRYSAPSFVKPELVRFRYRLIGLDDDWIEAGDRRVANFQGVQPGGYRFELTAAGHDGVWSSDGPSLGIVVLPPFWRTWWFLALALAGTASLALAAHGQRVRRLRRQHAFQEAFSQRLIDSQEGERRRISNEMHDSLGQHLAIIKKRARAGEETLSDAVAVRSALEDIAGLAETIDGEMTEIAYDLRPHHLDNIGLSKTIESMVRRVGRASDIEFETDIAAIDDVFPQSLHIHIFRIVQESVSNIVQHSKASRAKVAIVRDLTSVEIRVEDNGVGFSPRSFDPANPATHGFGLMGIRERARILGGQVEIHSSARIGTTVTVRFTFEGATHG
jgi:signal transduction histidine kinase/ligand-binding sensor domain-containing protein